MRTGPWTIVVAVLVVIGAGPLPAESAKASVASHPFIAQRQFEAVVTGMDRDAGGVLLLNTDAGRVRLDGAADAMRHLRKGERLLLDVTVLRHPDPVRIPREESPEHALLVRHLAAEITALQRTVGIVGLKTAAGRLEVDLPPAALAGLRTGDQLHVELSVLNASDASASPRSEESKRRGGVAALLWSILRGVRGGQ